MSINIEEMRDKILEIICPDDETCYTDDEYFQLIHMLVSLPFLIMQDDNYIKDKP